MSPALWVLMFLVACVMAGNGLIVPILPLYGKLFSSSATLVGMLLTVFGAARLVANFPAGLAFRRVGARRMLLLGNGLLLAGAVGAALAVDLGVLLFCRLVQGVGSGIFLTSAGVLVADASRDGTRGRFMAVYQGAIFLGAGIGPVVGGAIASAFGISAPFWAYAIVSLLALMSSFAVVDGHGTAASARPERALDWRGLLHSRPFAANLAMSFASGFVRTAALWQNIPLLAAGRFGMGFDMIGLAITVTSIANVVVLPLSGWLVDRFGSRWLPPISAVLFAVSLLLIGYMPLQWAFWAGVTLAGVAGGLNGPSLASALVEITPTHLLGPAMGAQRTAGDLGFVAGPVVVGLLADLTPLDQPGALAVNSAMLFLAAAIWIVNGPVYQDLTVEPRKP